MINDFSGQFRLSITRALGDQLAEALDKLTPISLTQSNLDLLEKRAEDERLASKSGVYQLYQQGELVYVGKADKSLSMRLGNHLRKISGRRNISIDDMSFKCLYVAEDFSAVAPEKLLIKKYKANGYIPWNANGFGNKDPGRNRDNTTLKANHFDILFPIDLSMAVEGLHSGEYRLHELLQAVKSGLPYNFRYDENLSLKDIVLWISSDRMLADEVFRLIAATLPEDWQISALGGYAIMYGDKRKDYPSAQRYYRGTEVVDHQPAALPVSDQGEELDDFE